VRKSRFPATILIDGAIRYYTLVSVTASGLLARQVNAAELDVIPTSQHGTTKPGSGRRNSRVFELATPSPEI